MENWKQIPVCPEYDVSDQGNFRRNSPSIRKRDYGPIRGSILSRGYRYVVLRVDGRKKTFQAHRLVMLAFVGPSDLQVNHKNGRKDDNRLENLEYVNGAGNRLHAKRVLDAYPKGDKHPNAKLSESDVVKILRLMALGLEDSSIAKQFGCTPTNIYYIRKGTAWAHIPRDHAAQSAND